MGQALIWLMQGMLVLAVAAGVRALFGRWKRAVHHVMLYPGATAMGAWVALQVLPIGATGLVLGVIAVQIGLTGVGTTMVSLSCLAVFAATCGVGILLPNVGVVSRSRSPR